MAGVPFGLVLLMAGLAAFVALEIAARALRLSDYPLFVRSPAFGYGFRPRAQGTMRRRFRWRTNAMGLRMDEGRPASADAIVLVGDSTVESGSHVDQEETLAARLAQATGRDVHPVACPGWSLENQLAFLRAHPQLRRAGTVVFVGNTENLVGLAPWQSESAQPTKPPASHAWYALMRATYLWRRAMFPSFFRPWPDGAGRTWTGALDAFLDEYSGRLIWLFYPLREEARQSLAPCLELRPLIADRAETFEIGAMLEWSDACYADRIHPNAKGRAVLLRALQQALEAPGVPDEGPDG